MFYTTITLNIINVFSKIDKNNFFFRLKKLVNLIGAHWSVDPRTKRGMINLKLPLTDFDPNKIARRRKT